MTWWQALIAGVIQGITEFLPVSSSGHLVIYQNLVGTSTGDSNLTFNVWLHFATLLAVIIVFRRDVWSLVKEFFGAIFDLVKGKPDFKSPPRRFLVLIIIATIPAVAVGIIIKLLNLDAILENIFVVAVMLIVTSILMFTIDKLDKGQNTEKDAPLQAALLVGVIQAVAVLPGLSRSGSTIFGGLLSGFKKEFAVRFAFILSIPVILGAGILELGDVIKTGELGVEPMNLIIGFVAAMLCGILSIGLIKILIKEKKFWIFGVYCLLASVVAFLVGWGILRF